MSTRTRKILLVGMLLVTAGGWSVHPNAVSAQEPAPYLTEPRVSVSRLGGVTASGQVDCSADVLAMWPGYVGAPDTVLTNVSWVATQRKGRMIVMARFDDAMASPCWARPGAPWVEPERCRLNEDGTFHPCTWDSYNYGSDGWMFGTAAFKTGATHLSATMDGGYYSVPGDDYMNLGSFSIGGWDLMATRG